MAQREKRGLEIKTIGAISLSQHSCVMPSPTQSLDSKTLESERYLSMLDKYVTLVSANGTELLSLTDILVSDAIFSGFEFVNEMSDTGLRFGYRISQHI